MEKKVYKKLVRDRIPCIIREGGALPTTRTLKGKEFSAALNEKLVEEVEEFLTSSDIEELADIYEVMLAILHDRDIPFAEFEAIRRKKAFERGAFTEKIFLVSVEEQ